MTMDPSADNSASQFSRDPNEELTAVPGPAAHAGSGKSNWYLSQQEPQLRESLKEPVVLKELIAGPTGAKGADFSAAGVGGMAAGI